MDVEGRATRLIALNPANVLDQSTSLQVTLHTFRSNTRRLDTEQLICLLCAEIHATGTWALIDPARQVSIDAVDLAAASGLDLTLCPVDRNGVIEHVRADHRRLGYGRLLVAAARTLDPDYRWTTTTIQPTLEAKAFWATVGWDGVGEPHYCSHQREATGEDA
jgi:GNAT superfamily N-acetyltransferase